MVASLTILSHSPSVYMVVNTIWGYNECGALGPTTKNAVFGFDLTDVSTLVPYTEEHATYRQSARQLYLSDLDTNCTQTFDGDYATETYRMKNQINRCNPSLVIPIQIKRLGYPYWAHCGNVNNRFGLFDPPYAIQPVDGLFETTAAVVTSEPAQATSTAQTGPSAAPELASSTSVAPVVTPTSEPEESIPEESKPAEPSPTTTNATVPEETAPSFTLSVPEIKETTEAVSTTSDDAVFIETQSSHPSESKAIHTISDLPGLYTTTPVASDIPDLSEASHVVSVFPSSSTSPYVLNQASIVPTADLAHIIASIVDTPSESQAYDPSVGPAPTDAPAVVVTTISELVVSLGTAGLEVINQENGQTTTYIVPAIGATEVGVGVGPASTMVYQGVTLTIGGDSSVVTNAVVVDKAPAVTPGQVSTATLNGSANATSVIPYVTGSANRIMGGSFLAAALMAAAFVA